MVPLLESLPLSLVGLVTQACFQGRHPSCFLICNGQGRYPIFQLLTPLFIYEDNVVPEVSVTLELQRCSDVATKSWPPETWVD